MLQTSISEYLTYSGWLLLPASPYLCAIFMRAQVTVSRELQLPPALIRSLWMGLWIARICQRYIAKVFTQYSEKASTSAFSSLKASFTSSFHDLFWTKWKRSACRLFQQREGHHRNLLRILWKLPQTLVDSSSAVYEYHFPRAVQTPTIVIGFKTVKISQRPHHPWDGFINEKGVAACK